MRAWAIAMLILMAGSALAGEAGDAPVHPQARYWAGKLTDPDPAVQQQARQMLRKIGKPALTALAEAARANDEPLRIAANEVAARIEQDLARAPAGVEVLPPPHEDPGPRDVPLPLPRILPPSPLTGPLRRLLIVEEGGRTIRIEEDADGVSVSVSEMIAGVLRTRVSKAKDAQALQREHPQAYELFEKYAAQLHNPPTRRFGPMLAPGMGLDLDDLPQAQRRQIERAFAQARDMMRAQRALLGRPGRLLEEHRRLAEEMRHQAMDELERMKRELEDPQPRH